MERDFQIKSSASKVVASFIGGEYTILMLQLHTQVLTWFLLNIIVQNSGKNMKMLNPFIN